MKTTTKSQSKLIGQLPAVDVSSERIQRVIDQEWEDRIDLHEARAFINSKSITILLSIWN